MKSRVRYWNYEHKLFPQDSKWGKPPRAHPWRGIDPTICRTVNTPLLFIDLCWAVHNVLNCLQLIQSEIIISVIPCNSLLNLLIAIVESEY